MKSVQLATLVRLLGRKGIITNNSLFNTKNDMLENFDYDASCATGNGQRYYGLDERSYDTVSPRKRSRALKV